MANPEPRTVLRRRTLCTLFQLGVACLLSAVTAGPAFAAADPTAPIPASETVCITKTDTVCIPSPTTEPSALFDRQVKFYDFALKAALGFLTFVGVFFVIMGLVGLRDIREVRKSAKAAADKMLEESKSNIDAMVAAFGTNTERLRSDLTDKVNEQTGKLISLAGQIETQMKQETAAICSRLKSEAEARVGATAEALVAETRVRLARAEEDLKSRLQVPPPAAEPTHPTERERQALALMNQAKQARDKGEHAAAVDLYTAALGFNPAAPGAYTGRGIALAMQNKLRQAAEDIAAAARLDASSHTAFYNWGVALGAIAQVQTGSEAVATFRDACAKYQRATEIKPDMHEAFNNWGSALDDLARFQSGDAAVATFKDACAKFQRATEIKPDMHEAYYNWGGALTDLARRQSGDEAKATFKAACAKYQRATEIKPDKHETFNNWGSALDDLARLQSGDEAKATFKDACAKYQRATEIKPDKHETFNNWGSALDDLARRQSGDEAIATFKDACAKFQRATEIKPDMHEAYYNWACACALAGDNDKAFELLELLKIRAPAKFSQAQTDADFNALHDDPRWQRLFT
jgi:Flp pilus assembly protein TadD